MALKKSYGCSVNKPRGCLMEWKWLGQQPLSLPYQLVRVVILIVRFLDNNCLVWVSGKRLKKQIKITNDTAHFWTAAFKRIEVLGSWRDFFYNDGASNGQKPAATRDWRIGCRHLVNSAGDLPVYISSTADEQFISTYWYLLRWIWPWNYILLLCRHIFNL